MSINFNLKSGSCQSQNTCLDTFGCPVGVCPDFLIKRHDTKPDLKIAVEDCDGSLDLQGLVIEANMWALAKFKSNVSVDDTYFRLADDIGFNQAMMGDIIVVDRVRNPEHMLVTGFDETNNLIRVQRAYHGTTASAHKKGSTIRIFRIMNAPASSEMLFEDVKEVDGTVNKDVLQASYLVYQWQAEDVCLPGCYWLEFKVLKMIDVVWYLPGGYWTGEKFTGDDGFFYTGISASDSSVRLSYDQIEDKYFIPNTSWANSIHLHTDDDWYTGSSHDEGSVILSKTGVSSDENLSYDENGLSALAISVTPSFTDISLTPSDYKCALGEGVEWVRRFPMQGEGFLIKIENGFTTEL